VAGTRHFNRTAALIVLVFWALICIFPLYWMLVSSLKPVDKIFSYPPDFLPSKATLEHYVALPGLIPSLGLNALNSLVLAVFTPLFSVFFSSLAGFAFAKFAFRGQNMLFAIVVLTQLIPQAAGFIPLFIQMTSLHLIDTLWAVFLPGLVPAFGIFLFRQAMYGVPDELLDAARIDGAGSFTLYRQIVIPLVMPMVTTQYILGFIGSWNNFLWPFIALRSPENYTLPVALASLQGLPFRTPWGSIMAGAVFLSVPAILIFSILSKYIVPDLTSGAFK
jgi:ABC-type glycerol-3-phosphate transport system permease component